MGTELLKIRGRLDEVDHQIGHHELCLGTLRSEREELAGALRVFDRFADDHRDLPPLPDSLAVADAPEDMVTDDRKPSGAPTMPEMIFEVLRENLILNSGVGLTPRAILERVREKWWAGARPENVSPITWRLWKEGKISKRGNDYVLMQDDDE